MLFRSIIPLALAGLSATAATAQSAAPSLLPAATAGQPAADRTHQFKLGLRDGGYSGWVPTLAYEWQVAPRVSVEVGASANFGSQRYGYDYQDYAGNITYTNVRYRHVGVMGFGQARYYLQASKPPLTGWYTALGLQSSYDAIRTTYTGGQTRTESYSRLRVQPQLFLGRQWALGRRLSLDTYLRLDYQAPAAGVQPATGVLQRIRPALGFQLGYRF